MSAPQPASAPPSPAPAVTLQDIVDRLSGSMTGQPLRAVEARLRADLADAGLRPPSRTWVDSVARELALGQEYVVSLEAQDRPDIPPGGHQELYAAPARLRILPATTPPEPPRGPVRREGLRELARLAPVAATLALLWTRRARKGKPHDR